MKNRAWVSVPNEMLAQLLGLPEGTEIVRADANGFDFRVRFGIQGPTLPVVEDGTVCPDISMLFYQEDKDGIRTLYGSWSHTPSERWLIRRQLTSDFHVVDFPTKRQS